MVIKKHFALYIP